jgi:hypothetical protein
MLKIKGNLFYVDQCDAHTKNTTFLIAVKVLFLPGNCARQLQLLDLETSHAYKCHFGREFERLSP